jgi:carboxypeptidase Taq
MLRFDLERAMLSGELPVAGLPTAWNERMRSDLGLRVPDDARGCLQDIHWSMGMFGYFPNYALGETFAAQLFERASAEDPSIPVQLGQGDFTAYRAWVAPRIHHRASQVAFSTLVEEATGAPLSAAALKRHLRRRYIEEAGPA